MAGIDAPTPARVDVAAAPTGDSTFFRRERKYQRKHAARRLREKALYCPFWRRGSLCRAQHSWPAYAYHRARSELAFFRRQNGRAFFPPLPIAALLRRSWRWAYLPLAGWDASMWPEGFAAWINGLMFFSRSQRGAYAALAGWDVSLWLEFFATQKASVILISRWPLLRAMRPVTEWRYELANRQEAAPDRRAVAPFVPRR